MIRRGLLDPAEIVRGEFSVEQIDRHNRGFLVRRPAARPLFVKQLTNLDRFNIACLEREAHCFQLVASRETFAPLRSRMPVFVDFDSDRHAVTVELLPDSCDLLESMEQDGEIPADTAWQVGQFVSLFESDCGRELARALDPRLCTGEPPWILSFHLDQGDGWLSPANSEFLRSLQADEQLTQALDEIRSGWQADSLMHTDLKWNNVLVVPGEDGGRPDCRIIDWEMVNRGDAAWDAATMMQSWWWYHVLSTPPAELTELAGLDAFFERRGGAFEQSRPSLESFWSGFVENLPAESHGERLTTCIRFAAARLLQTVYELQQAAEEISDQGRLLIEMSRCFLAEPESALPFFPGGTTS